MPVLQAREQRVKTPHPARWFQHALVSMSRTAKAVAQRKAIQQPVLSQKQIVLGCRARQNQACKAGMLLMKVP